jgi:hypothetical protein
MALPECSLPQSGNMPPRSAPVPLMVSGPGAALRRLPELRDESRLALRRAGLLARAVPAAGSLLGLGMLAAMSGGGGLTATFAWSLLIFLGVAAVLASHLRAASVFKDLPGSAADMRAIFLYLGVAWGVGAFLAMAPQPVLLVPFSAAPTLMLALLLGDVPAILAFAAPATALGFAAIFFRTGNMSAAAILLLFQAASGFFLLRKRTMDGAPDSALR